MLSNAVVDRASESRGHGRTRCRVEVLVSGMARVLDLPADPDTMGESRSPAKRGSRVIVEQGEERLHVTSTCGLLGA